MKSMTGYGRGECSQDGFKITVELSSVNRKQSEISVALPREIEMLESQVRDLINRYIARGRLNVRVALHAGTSNFAARMHLNVPLAKAYARELNRLARQLKLPGPVTLDQLARAPGVFQTDEQIVEEEDFWPAVEAPVEEDERLLKEIVYFADRADISEELTRLQSHYQQFEDCLQSTEPIGRTLDFLAQEMNREVNTIGSKANDSLISREVVTLKAELERFREQAQNVE